MATPLTILLTALAGAQGGDDCSSATAIGTTGTFAFDTTSASTSLFDGGGACGSGSDTINQDLFWQWTAPASGDFQFDTEGSVFDTKLSVHSGVGCAATCAGYDDDAGAGLTSRVRILNVTAGATYLVQAGGYNVAFGPGQLNISQYVDPCSGLMDDSFEPNDSCSAPAILSAGVFSNLLVTVNSPDYYEITVPAGEILTVVADYQLTVAGDLNMQLEDAGCGTTVAFDTFGNPTTLTYNNTTGVSASYVLFVEASSFGAESCTDYTLDVSLMPDPCLTAMDDMFEDNDDCGQEVLLGSGSYMGLRTSKTDWDYFKFSVNDGDTIQIDTLGDLATGDVDVILYLEGSCEPFASGDVACANSIACGYTTADNEQIFWTNNLGSTQTVIAKINVWPGSTGPDCGPYDLIVSGADGTGGILGTPYCDPAVPNTTGLPGLLAATGSGAAADDNFTLVGSQLPDGQFAFFIAARTQGFIPNPSGSQGNLCVIGAIARFNQPGQLGVIAGGEFSLQVPLTDVPEPPAFGVSILAGETWNFQLWHRDWITGMGATSNFTHGLEVAFQ